MKFPSEEEAEMIMRWVVILSATIFLLWLAGAAGWLDKIKPYFEEYVNIFTGLGYLAVLFGIILTVTQIISAKKQIRAGISYRIHKDGRDIRNAIKDKIVKVIESPLSSKISPEDEEKARKAIRETLMYFSSVFHQYDFGNIDKSEWKLLKEQFLNFLDNDRVGQYWEDKIADNHPWHKGLRVLGNDFLTEKQRRKK